MNRKKKKVLHVLSSLNMGGAEIFAVNLLRELDKKFQLYLIVINNQEDENVKAILAKTKVKIFKLDKKNRGYFSTFKDISNIIKKISPNIIHLHCPYHIKYFVLSQTRIICTLHTDLKKNYGEISTFLYRVLFKLKKVTVVNLSNCLNPFFKNNIYIPSAIKIHKVQVKKRRFDMIAVGRLDEVKNYHWLIRELRSISNKKLNVALAIVGDGDQTKLKKLIRSLSLEKNVFLLGKRNDIFDLLSQSTIFTSSSKWEGMPLSLIEAMAAGKVVLMPKLGAIPEMLENDEGQLFSPSNKNEYFKKAIAILEDKKLQTDSSAKNILRSKRYSIVKVADNYLKLYNEKI